MKNSEVKQEIINVLKIREDNWTNTFLDSANETARLFCCGNPSLKQQLLDCPAFWYWYEDQFAIIDRKFLTNYRYRGSSRELTSTLANIWHSLHMEGLPQLQLPSTILKTSIKQTHREGAEI